MSEIPEELLYTREHEWIRLDGNKGEVGITAYAQQSLGDIVYVELSNIDDEVDKGDEFGTIESVKAVSSLFMPATGKILEVNTELKERPELINEDCYDEGWLVRISIDHPEDQENMMDAEAYREFLEESDPRSTFSTLMWTTAFWTFWINAARVLDSRMRRSKSSAFWAWSSSGKSSSANGMANKRSFMVRFGVESVQSLRITNLGTPAFFLGHLSKQG